MRKMLWKLFPPFEVKLTIEEIKSFLGAHAFLSQSIIEPVAVALAKDAERTIYSIRIDGMKPDRLALLLITNVIGEQLACGQHHVYRGTLSMIGRDMLKVWTTAVSTLKERGYYTEAEAEEDIKWIKE